MESYIRNIITYNKWTLKKLLKHETWPTEQQGHIVVPAPIEGTEWECNPIWKWDRVDGLAESYEFFGLWRSRSPFFHILTADASWGERNVTRWGGEVITASIATEGRMLVNNAPKQGRHSAVLRQVWDGKSGRGIPSSALLKDAIWADGDDHYLLYCWTTIKRKLDHVARRIVAAHRFPVSEEMTKKFAALLLAEKLGWEKLSKWQMVEISLMAADVDHLLTEKSVTEEVAEAPLINPSPESRHTIIHITHSLGHQHVPSLTARQAQRSAVSQEVLRRLWA